MINKSDRLLPNYSFKFHKHDIQLCQEYLGIVFTPCGSFTNAINLLEIRHLVSKIWAIEGLQNNKKQKILCPLFDYILESIFPTYD